LLHPASGSVLAGTSNDLTARTLLLNSTAATYNGLVRSPDVTIEPIWVDTYAGSGQWNCTVSYNAKAADIGMVTISGDTSSGTQHLVQSIANVQRYAPSGSTAPDFKGAIGVTKDSVEGVDVVCPVANYTVTKVWDAAALPNLGTIYSLTGTDDCSGIPLKTVSGKYMIKVDLCNFRIWVTQDTTDALSPGNDFAAFWNAGDWTCKTMNLAGLADSDTRCLAWGYWNTAYVRCGAGGTATLVAMQ